LSVLWKFKNSRRVGEYSSSGMTQEINESGLSNHPQDTKR
jgi:hypothetical protein